MSCHQASAPGPPPPRVRAAMGHLPTKTRRCLLSLLGLFVLLEVGKPINPSPRSRGSDRRDAARCAWSQARWVTREERSARSLGARLALFSLRVRGTGWSEHRVGEWGELCCLQACTLLYSCTTADRAGHVGVALSPAKRMPRRVPFASGRSSLPSAA